MSRLVCSGLVSHMACSYWLAVDPSTLPAPGGLPAERAADLYVESRRSMTPAEVVADYESVSSRGLEVLAAIEGQDVEIPIGDVGTYPASVVPTTFVFESFIHLRYDLFAPDGPCSQIRRPSTSYGLPHARLDRGALPQQNTTCSTIYASVSRFASTGCAPGPCTSAPRPMWPHASRRIRKPSCVGSPNAAPGKGWAFRPKGTRRPWRSSDSSGCSERRRVLRSNIPRPSYGMYENRVRRV